MFDLKITLSQTCKSKMPVLNKTYSNHHFSVINGSLNKKGITLAKANIGTSFELVYGFFFSSIGGNLVQDVILNEKNHNFH